MSDTSDIPRAWLLRLAYVSLALIIMFFHLLPLNLVPRDFAAPDVLLAITLAWALRKPETVPLISVAGVALLADLLLHRPPGLLALLIVLGAEHLKQRQAGMRDATFVAEWTSVASVILLITVANRVLLFIFAVETAPLLQMLSQLVLTILVYPLVVFASRVLMGVRKASPGGLDSLRQRV